MKYYYTCYHNVACNRCRVSSNTAMFYESGKIFFSFLKIFVSTLESSKFTLFISLSRFKLINRILPITVFSVCFFCLLMFLGCIYSKICLNGHSHKEQKLVFKIIYSFMQVKRIAECSKGSILQYFRPSLTYHLSLRALFCLFLSDHLRRVFLHCTLLRQSRYSEKEI